MHLEEGRGAAPHPPSSIARAQSDASGVCRKWRRSGLSQVLGLLCSFRSGIELSQTILSLTKVAQT